jgi:hypothetical protein
MTPEETRAAFAQALREARKLRDAGDTAAARKAFWQAHQIGRYDTVLHVISHFELMRFALHTRNLSEAWSQSWLTLAALVITWLRPRIPRERGSPG